MKKLLRKIIPKFFDYQVPGKINNNQSVTAVIYSIDRIGDAIACSIAINAIKNHYSNAKIIVVCSNYSYSIFQSDSDLTCYTLKNSNALFSITKTALKIKKKHGKIDLLFSPTAGNKIPPNIFMGILRAKCNIVVEKKRFMMHQPELGVINDGSLFYRYKKELEKHGLPAKDRPTVITKSDAVAKKDMFINRFGLSKYIAVNLDAFDKKRCFPAGIVKEIKNRLDLMDIDFVIVCPADKKEEYKRVYGNTNRIFIYEDINTIHDSIAILKDASLVISPDTALVHIASAFNIPTVAVYRDEHNAKYWPPMSDRKESIIMPCDLNTCNEIELADRISKIIMNDIVVM
ncbi:glycosyltransferase family 9 protein [Zobellella maritima]|uniref:glycosyltransferase family 9 protein n=1 Tax=Zobellella maritima TaxID=2059725 RepID=UPI000E307E5B|nr:glycosyltransferase family 9 protein [Zobellella maritima]